MAAVVQRDIHFLSSCTALSTACVGCHYGYPPLSPWVLAVRHLKLCSLMVLTLELSNAQIEFTQINVIWAVC